MLRNEGNHSIENNEPLIDDNFLAQDSLFESNYISIN
jgi:hypothetical protein